MSNMEIKTVTFGGDVQILKRPPFEGIALTLNFANVVAGADGKKVVKAGSPISAAGVVANTGDAIGILLFDVYEARPQATIIKKGYINTAVAQAHSGVTIASAAKAVLPMVVFE